MYAKVLIIEENRALAKVLRDSFVGAGFRVFNAFTESDAGLQINLVRPNVILLGWLRERIYYPGYLKRIRDDVRIRNCALVVLHNGTVPIGIDRALDAGADDVFELPLATEEMVARVRMLLKRRAPEFSGLPISIANLRLDPDAKQAAMFGRKIKLTPTEFDVLYYLASYPGISICRDQILDAIWSDRFLIEERSVDVYVRRIRRSLGPLGDSIIQTIRGTGYLFSLKATEDDVSVEIPARKPCRSKDEIGPVLLIEKDATLRGRFEKLLETEGFQVIAVASPNGWKMVSDHHSPCLIIASPKKASGSPVNTIRHLRDSVLTKDLPIIWIDSNEERTDRLSAYGAGVDDLVRPRMGDREFLARVRSTLRRWSAAKKPSLIELNGLYLDPTTYLIAFNGQEINASPTEFKLLHHLLATPGRAYSRQQLLTQVWGRDRQVNERSVDVQVRRLRVMLRGADLIQTVRGIGYCGRHIPNARGTVRYADTEYPMRGLHDARFR